MDFYVAFLAIAAASFFYRPFASIMNGVPIRPDAVPLQAG
jgi:hypothetical protein